MKKTIGNLTVRIGADTKQFTNAMKRTQRDTRSLSKQFGGLQRAAISAIGAYASFSFIKRAISAYDTQAKAVRSLEVALGGSTVALERQASALQKVTRFGDETIITQQAFLASLGFTEGKIKQIIPAALDLAAATGQTLEFAVRNLAKTYAGLTGELGELIPELKNFTKEELQAGAATEYATKQFAGQAAAAAASGAGAITQLSNSFGDLTESIGEALVEAEAFTVFIDTLKSLTEMVQSGSPGGVFQWMRVPQGEKQRTRDDVEKEIRLLEGRISRFGMGQRTPFTLIQKVELQNMRDELKKLNDELATYGEKVEGSGSVAEVTHTWAESLADLEEQLATNNKQLKETRDLDVAGRLNAENKALEEQIRLRKIALGITPVHGRSAVPTRLEPIQATSVDGGSRLPTKLEFKPDHLFGPQTEWEKYLQMLGVQFPGALETFQRSLDNTKTAAIDMSTIVGQAISQMAMSIATAISDAVSGADTFAGSFFKGMISVITQFMRALGQAMIAAGLASQAFQELLLTQPLAAIAAGFALTAAAGLVEGIMRDGPEEFASGAVVSGPTLAWTGEYSGARNNPEVIAPLNKLKDMMGGTNVNVTGMFRVRGTDLVLALEKANDKISNYG